MRRGYFDPSDSVDGNPFLDESLTVIEPVIVFDWDVSKGLGYTIKAAYDNVASASKLCSWTWRAWCTHPQACGLGCDRSYDAGQHARVRDPSTAGQGQHEIQLVAVHDLIRPAQPLPVARGDRERVSVAHEPRTAVGVREARGVEDFDEGGGQ